MKRIVIGLILIALAFFTGAQKDAFLGLLGFLGFFTIGITLVIEGFRKRSKG